MRLQEQTLRNKLAAAAAPPLLHDAYQYLNGYLYLRCASVTVFIGNGFNAAAPGHGDVTILETHINAYYGHNERSQMHLNRRQRPEKKQLIALSNKK